MGGWYAEEGGLSEDDDFVKRWRDTKLPGGTLGIDSEEYEILAEVAKDVAPKVNAWVEIGTRAGGSAELLMSLMVPGQTFISVDPYGGIPYFRPGPNIWVPGDISLEKHGLGYTNKLRFEATAALCNIANHMSINFIPLPLEDTEFMHRFADGVPSYAGAHKRLESVYDLVFLDGPHQRWAIWDEFRFFAPRMSEGGVIIIDDMEGLQGLADELRDQLTWVPIKTGKRKAAFVRGHWQ